VRSRGIWFALAYLSLLGLLLPGAPIGAQQAWRVEGIPSTVKQGDVFKIRLTVDGWAMVSGDFQGREIPFYPWEDGKGYEALIGVDLECPAGTSPLNINVRKGNLARKWKFQVEVVRGFFGVQRITLPPEMVDLDPQSLERVREEKGRIEAIIAMRSENRSWTGEFLVPVEGGISTFFGVSRILNGQRRGRHNGIDIKARHGEKILCPNNGRVVVVDELFFGGKTVVVDHGQGLYSFFMHLEEVAVQAGRDARKGDLIGTVGATGRATGPHLHWGVLLNGARVDPLALMEATTDDKKAIEMVRNRKYIAEKWKKRSKNGEKLGQGGETLD
jgi:hypothetical protein